MMKQGQFAPITAALLARKGEARPWEYGAANTQSREASFGSRSPRPLEVPPPPKENAGVSGDEIRKLTMRVSHADYERLGIIATKRDTTRQRLLHTMLDQFLAGAADEYGASCGCIGGSCRKADSGGF
jgi:hypothetical protein